MQALIGVAVVEVAATLVVLPWAWDDYHRVHGELAVYEAIKLVALATAAFLLLTAGRRELRTWLLGVYCLLKATLPPLHMLPAFFLEIAPPEQFTAFVQALPASSRLFLYLYVPAYLFAPAFLWAFARECPRVHRRARLDDLARRMVPVSVAIGFAIWVGTPATVQLAQAGYEVPVSLLFDASIATLHVLALAAVVVVALRAHTAPAAEVRRVAVFAAGFLMHAGVSAAYDVAEVVSPGHWVANYQWSPTVLLIQVMHFPGMIVLWYSVLAARVPHVREVVRACYRRLLSPPGLLEAAATAPAVGLGWLALSRALAAASAVLAQAGSIRSRTSAIAHLLESVGGTLRVHPDDESSLFRAAAARRRGVGDRDRSRCHRTGAGSGRRADRCAGGPAPLRRPHHAVR